MQNLLRLGKHDVASASIDRKEFSDLGGEGHVLDAYFFQRGRPRTEPVRGHPLAKVDERGIFAGERTPQRFARADADVAAVVDHGAAEKQLTRTPAQGAEERDAI